jgi:Ni/Fe-hydrogenase subunit HybB-like protein
LVIRFGDLIWRGEIATIFAFDLNSFMFIIENILFIYPLVILSSAEKREKPKQLFISAISLILAGSLYRFNAYLIGFNPGEGWNYFPAFGEVMITVGIIAMEIMAYLIFVKKFPVLPAVKHA